MQERKPYSRDIKDAQWEVLKGYIPQLLSGGRPERYQRREILNGILYVLRTGCAWRELPHDLPPWDTVYGYLRRWTRRGLWDWMGGRLREDARRRLKKSRAHGGDSRQPNGKDRRTRRPLRLRRQQKTQGSQTASALRHQRLTAGLGDYSRRRAGSRWTDWSKSGPTPATLANGYPESRPCGPTTNSIWKLAALWAVKKDLWRSPIAGSLSAALPGPANAAGWSRIASASSLTAPPLFVSPLSTSCPSSSPANGLFQYAPRPGSADLSREDDKGFS